MSIEREITIRILSKKEKFSDLFIEFIDAFWFNKNDFIISSLDKEDKENYDFINFSNFNSLKPILNYRESKDYNNFLSFFVEKLDERILIRSTRSQGNFAGSSYQYELSFSLGIGKRIKNAERYTDFSFYLNQILPRLLDIECEICEIKCHDYDF